jgi:hypothetical protein
MKKLILTLAILALISAGAVAKAGLPEPVYGHAQKSPIKESKHLRPTRSNWKQYQVINNISKNVLRPRDNNP